MKVQLMLTCLCDAFYGEVGIATVKVLESLGCTVTFDEKQTCCGQPAFNSGDIKSADSMATKWLSVFNEESPIVVPSASCAAMVTEGFEMVGRKEKHREVYELGQFITKFFPDHIFRGLKEETDICFHKSCHGRMIHLGDVHSQVFKNVERLRVIPFVDGNQCCGFGGAFAVNLGSVSRDIGITKLETLAATGIKTIVGADMGCLMHLSTLAEKEGYDLRFHHFAEVLSWAI